MHEVTNYLEKIGLTETEQKLYLAGLSHVNIDVTQLIRETGINRTTAYHALGTLKQKGLATETKHNGKLSYSMTHPEHIVTYLDSQKAKIDEQKARLANIINQFPTSMTATQKIRVEHFDGIENVKQAIEHALYCASREWRIIAPAKNLFSEVGGTYAEYFMHTRKQRNIESRTLWEKKRNSTSTLSDYDILRRKPRYLPEEFKGSFSSTIILFDETALFISSTKQPNAILIESQEMVSTLTILFDGLYRTADKPTS